jgi:hypothetical protein
MASTRALRSRGGAEPAVGSPARPASSTESGGCVPLCLVSLSPPLLLSSSPFQKTHVRHPLLRAPSDPPPTPPHFTQVSDGVRRGRGAAPLGPERRRRQGAQQRQGAGLLLPSLSSPLLSPSPFERGSPHVSLTPCLSPIPTHHPSQHRPPVRAPTRTRTRRPATATRPSPPAPLTPPLPPLLAPPPPRAARLVAAARRQELLAPCPRRAPCAAAGAPTRCPSASRASR